MFISIGIDEDGRPYITTSDGSREKVVRKGKGKSVIDFPSTINSIFSLVNVDKLCYTDIAVQRYNIFMP